jgi:hypothetical protein
MDIAVVSFFFLFVYFLRPPSVHCASFALLFYFFFYNASCLLSLFSPAFFPPVALPCLPRSNDEILVLLKHPSAI